MKFTELDKRMRVFETSHDHCVLPGIFIVARIDGRSFTRLTKELQDFEAPFDVRFRDHMIATTQHLMQCGFSAIYGYTQSDEISLLFARNEQAFGRKLRKFNSVLAGEASAAFTHSLGTPATLDCRISQLPQRKDVIDYFRWRQEDAYRNALGGHCYWLLRRQGLSEHEATERLLGASVADRNELLFQNGINANELPGWQKRGTGLYWEQGTKEGFNPKTQEKTLVQRRVLQVDFELPLRDEYNAFLSRMVDRAEGAP